MGRGVTVLRYCAIAGVVCLCSCSCSRFAQLTPQEKVAKAKADLVVLQHGIDQFRLDCDRYPTVAEVPRGQIVEPPKASGWHGPYLPTGFGVDPWGNQYHYERGYENWSYVIKSFGADGKPGGRGFDADIVDGTD